NDRARRTQIAAIGADRLRQRAHLQRYVDVRPCRAIDESRAAAIPDNPQSVRIVAEKPSVEPSGERGESRQRREVAVHRKYAVGGDERALFAAAMPSQYGFGVVQIAMLVELDLRAAQFRAGVYAGMRQFINEDQVVSADHGRNDAGICEITGAEHTGRFGALDPREPRFKLVVERMIAGDQARGPRADAISLDGVHRRGDDLRMVA